MWFVDEYNRSTGIYMNRINYVTLSTSLSTYMFEDIFEKICWSFQLTDEYTTVNNNSCLLTWLPPMLAYLKYQSHEWLLIRIWRRNLSCLTVFSTSSSWQVRSFVFKCYTICFFNISVTGNTVSVPVTVRGCVPYQWGIRTTTRPVGTSNRPWSTRTSEPSTTPCTSRRTMSVQWAGAYRGRFVSVGGAGATQLTACEWNLGSKLPSVWSQVPWCWWWCTERSTFKRDSKQWCCMNARYLNESCEVLGRTVRDRSYISHGQTDFMDKFFHSSLDELKLNSSIPAWMSWN